MEREEWFRAPDETVHMVAVIGPNTASDAGFVLTIKNALSSLEPER